MSSSDSSSRSRSRQKGNGKRVYVTGYSLKQDTHDLKKLFKKYGKIQEFAWKGKYCFIEFYKEDDAKKAVKKLNKEDINGYTLVVELAKGRKQSSNVCYACGRSGHFAKSCKRKPRSSSSSSDSSEKKKKKHKKEKKKRRSSSSSSSSSSKSSRSYVYEPSNILETKSKRCQRQKKPNEFNLDQYLTNIILFANEREQTQKHKQKNASQIIAYTKREFSISKLITNSQKQRIMCTTQSRSNKFILNTIIRTQKGQKFDATDFGGWDDAPTIIPENNSRKSCSQQVQRNKLIPYVQKQRKFTPKKIMLKMSQVPSPMIEYPIQRRLDTLNNQLLMLQGMSEFFGNDRFNKVLQGMNSVVLSRRVKRGNRVLSSKSFM